MKKKRKLHGFNMMELVFGMVIIGILMTLAVTSYVKGRDKANELVIEEAFGAYGSAVLDSFTSDPTLQLSTVNAVDDVNSGKELTYSPEKAHGYMVSAINLIVDDELKLTWNTETRRYESAGEDPYGGRYVLVDYPVDLTGRITEDNPSGKDVSWAVDDISIEENSKPAYKFLIASTGKTDNVDSLNKLSAEDKAIAICISDGLVDTKLHGEETPLFAENYYIPYF